MSQLVLATGNQGKVREFSSLLADFGYEVIPQTQLNVIEAEETGLSFVENAILKARNAAKQTGLPALADDSGLAVNALNGQPGIYSARYAGVGSSDADNNAKLLEILKDTPEAERGAYFRCCIVMVRDADDPVPLIAEASWHGRILQDAQGEQGFGYDPLFYVPSHDCSSAQLDREEKNLISHRALAMQKLKVMLEQGA